MINSNPKIATQNIWIIGYGDIGRRVADLYQIAGKQTSATVKSKESINKFKKAHQAMTRILRLDLDTSPVKTLPSLQDSNVFYFVPPPPTGRWDSRISNFVKNMTGQPKRIVLISTTGVYGDCNGEWVDETQAINPLVDRAWRRADAEQQVRAWAKHNQREYIILRVPGIYAEDRLPIKRIEAGLPIVNKEEAPWTNRIHADDLANACYHAMQATIVNETINVSDGNPSTMTDYFNQVADYVNLPRPPQINLQQAETELSKGMLSYMKESRKISNKKMLEKLKITLHYPCLADCLKKKHKTP